MRRPFRTTARYIFYAALSLIVLLFAANRYIAHVTVPYRSNDPLSLPRAQAVLVPGAAVYRSGALTPAYLDRVDTAYALYASGIVPKILVSGDGSGEGYDEVTPARNYLLGRGVPPEDIFLDYDGVNTYESMYRARERYGVSSAIIVTQPFHLPRAVFLAQWFGIDAYGAETAEWTGGPRDFLRESLATVKAVADVLGSRAPVETSEPAREGFIEGDGTASWHTANN